ncbi:MAG TPA: hypothetical protein DCZ05_11835 [Deltaproteobacteria bacterium]|nr:hypothetical protein [Deltaproteobacteria bacterium]
MGSKEAEIGAFEAKTRLSELLRETQRGKSFVIRRRGKAVARLVPPVDEGEAVNLNKILVEFREMRKRLPRMVKVHALVEEGRRF